MDDALGTLERLLAEARELEQAGEPARARALLAGAPVELGGFGSLHYARGTLAFRAGELEAALGHFREAVRYDPDVAEFHANLGAALLERGRSARDPAAAGEALAVLERAVALSPVLATAHANLGLAYQLAGRHAHALQAFAEAARRDPSDAGPRYNRAASLHALGREDECLRELEALLALQPGLVPALRSRCATLARLGRPEEARTALEAYLRAAPKAADAAELRALIG